MIKSFDDVLDKRIGAGKYQMWQFFLISMTEWFRGLIEVLLSILVIQWKSQLGITITQQGQLFSIYLLSQAIGMLFSLFFSNKSYRSVFITLAYPCQALATVLLAFSQIPSHLFIPIFGFGFFQGMTLPIAIVSIGEIMPRNIRGKMMVLLYGVQIFGSQFILLSCNFYLPSYEEGPWRIVVLILLPLYIVMGILSVLTLKENPRFLLFLGQYTMAFETIQLMGEVNHKQFAPLTEKEKSTLISWTHLIQKRQKEQQINIASPKDLFNHVNLTITISILILNFLLGLVLYGYTILIPTILHRAILEFTDQMKVYTGDIIGLSIIMLIIENKNFGRKNSSTLFLIFLIFVQAAFIIFQDQIITQCLIGVRISLRVLLCCVALMAMESYSTPLRSIGVSSAQFAMRAGGILSSYFILKLYDWSLIYTEYCLILLCIICVFLVQIFSIDRTQQRLDQSSGDQSQE